MVQEGHGGQRQVGHRESTPDESVQVPLNYLKLKRSCKGIQLELLKFTYQVLKVLTFAKPIDATTGSQSVLESMGFLNCVEKGLLFVTAA
ncbi:hypothetical protein UY3_02842 [Chelonia mydas]|uniref:Uncharacterized protein n=1 Tax=Chelonia mydas TaxID=8469 RepID=M7BPQ9_CHEMY|nr:hypothetical protein UY3_02842 [Chelonia mydas]